MKYITDSPCYFFKSENGRNDFEVVLEDGRTFAFRVWREHRDGLTSTGINPEPVLEIQSGKTIEIRRIACKG